MVFWEPGAKWVSRAEVEREIYYHYFSKGLTSQVVIESNRSGQRVFENAYKLIFVYASIRKLAKRPASKAVVCEFDSHSKYQTTIKNGR